MLAERGVVVSQRWNQWHASRLAAGLVVASAALHWQVGCRWRGNAICTGMAMLVLLAFPHSTGQPRRPTPATHWMVRAQASISGSCSRSMMPFPSTCTCHEAGMRYTQPRQDPSRREQAGMHRNALFHLHARSPVAACRTTLLLSHPIHCLAHPVLKAVRQHGQRPPSAPQAAPAAAAAAAADRWAVCLRVLFPAARWHVLPAGARFPRAALPAVHAARGLQPARSGC